jgi:hypothetical protein
MARSLPGYKPRSPIAAAKRSETTYRQGVLFGCEFWNFESFIRWRVAEYGAHAEGRALGVRRCRQSGRAVVTLSADAPHERRIILFLDFDGVLHCWFPRADRSDDENKYFAYLPHLEALLREFPSVDIVIASDWRLTHTLEELRSHFAQDVRNRVLDTTERVRPPSRTPGHRERQTQQFLQRNAISDVDWIALDDDPTCYTSVDRLVLCDDGFREKEEVALRSLLGRLVHAARRATLAIEVQNASISFDRALTECFSELISIEPELAQLLIEVFGSTTAGMR